MEREIKERIVTEQIRQKRMDFKMDIKRKTESTKIRESVNLKLRKAIDFSNVVGLASKLQRTGDFDRLTSYELNKLKNGSPD